VKSSNGVAVHSANTAISTSTWKSCYGRCTVFNQHFWWSCLFL